MQRNKWIFLFTGLLAFSFLTPAARAEDITITTYYPSPNGTYDALSVKRLSVGDTNADGSINASDVSATSGYLLVSDKLGIGTTTPQTKLQINAVDEDYTFPNPGSTARGALFIRSTTSDKETGITFSSANSNNAQAGIYVHQDNSVGTHMYLATTNSYATGPQARMTILNNGNVGIGMVAPGTRLHVYGDGGWPAGFRTEYSGGSGNGWNIVDGTDNNLYIGYGSSSAPSVKMVIQNGGNVGIGTASPGFNLDLVGRGRVTGSSTINSGGIFCATSGETKYGFVGLNNNSNMGFWGSSAGWAFTMDTSNGYVGVGTTAPTSNLHVYDSTVGSYTDNALKVATGYGYATFGSLNTGWFHISTDRPAFYFNNPCQANGGFSTYSSRERKKDIQHLSESEEDKILESLSKMQMAKFRYKDERFNKKVHLGIIAEESPDQLLTDDKKAIELVDYISYAVTAIKAQERQIKAQQSQIEELKKEIRRLQKK